MIAQTETTDSTKNYEPLKNIVWNGTFRSYFYQRHLPIKYDDTPSGVNWYKLNGGYNEPLIRLNAKASPTTNSNIEIEYTLDNLMTGQLTGIGSSGEYGRVSLPLQSIRLNSDVSTKQGNFSLQVGGIRFYSLTPMTFGGFTNENDLFERLPWESEDHPWTRYKKQFGKSQTAQAANSRFGSAIFQGVIIEGAGLPGGLGLKSMYGKSINSGGYQSWLNNNPKKIHAHRLNKKFSNLAMGLNFYNSFGRVSETSRKEEITRLFTSDFEYGIKRGVALSGELGYGDYQSPSVTKKGGEIIKTELNLNEHVAWLNVDVQYYRIGQYVVNQNSELINTSVSTASNVYGDTANLGNGYLPGVVTNFRQLTNNKQGVNLKLSKSLGKFSAALGIGTSQELVSSHNAVSFQHRLNKDTRSRFNVFQTGVGPYDRLTSVYLTTYETIGITDTGAVGLKAFNTIDVKLKYNTRVLGKEIILISSSNYNTVNKEVSVLPSSKDAYLKLLYFDTQAFVHLKKDIVLVLMTGIERAKGGMNTVLADNGKPIDQKGKAYGVRFDFQLSDRSGLYLRHRWFSHQDENFKKDHFRGTESSVELKIFF